jgi:type I restriction enzyme S subunit
LVKEKIDGSVVPHLYQKDFERMYIPIPDKKTLVSFEEQLKSIFKVIFKNKQESKSLSNLRNTLLPKLITGKLEISQME